MPIAPTPRPNDTTEVNSDVRRTRRSSWWVRTGSFQCELGVGLAARDLEGVVLDDVGLHVRRERPGDDAP